MIAFAISSFFAGIAGALFASFVGQLPPETGTSSCRSSSSPSCSSAAPARSPGTLLGTFFVVLCPRFIEEFADWMSDQAAGDGSWGGLWDVFVSRGAGRLRADLDRRDRPGFPLPSSALDDLLYGSLVIVFLLFEPLGLYGIWVKIRNYWKGWPFTY